MCKEDWLEAFLFISAIFGSTIVFISLIIVAIIPFDYLSCKSRAAALEMNYSWGPAQGCFVIDSDNKALPLNIYLNRIVEQNIAIRNKDVK